MGKHCPNVCKLRLCLATESTNSARVRTIVTAVLQRQYSQMELSFWIPYILSLLLCFIHTPAAYSNVVTHAVFLYILPHVWFSHDRSLEGPKHV